MTRPDDRSFVRYLESKRTVDDRALYRPAFDRLAAALDARAADRAPDPVRILEVGFGVGTMVDRLRERGALPARTEYLGVDVDERNVRAARERLLEGGFEAVGGAGERLRAPDGELTVELRAADALEFAAAEAGLDDGSPRFDLVIGMAFLDVVDLDRALDRLLPLAAGGGLAYFPITFDGETIFRPVCDPEFERRLLEAYRATMDDPERPGGSRTGRRLFDALPAAGAELLAAGGSDWVVHPRDGAYPADEAYFLRHILGTVERAVGDADAVDPDRLAAWAERRRRQVDRAELVYAAHNFDALARVP